MFGTKSPDPLIRFGSYARLIGVLLIVSPVLGTLMHSLVVPEEPNRLLDPLPGYHPTAIAYRHPAWVAVFSAPIGLCLVYAAAQFLNRQAAGLRGLRGLCWAGAGVLVALGTLTVAALGSISRPELLFFTIIGAVLYFAFATILVKFAR